MPMLIIYQIVLLQQQRFAINIKLADLTDKLSYVGKQLLQSVQRKLCL